jgi:hypothetical protein
MPAIDACEPQVIRALEKAGWAVLERQFTIRLPDASHFFADAKLQQTDKQIIIVEVKCFPSNRAFTDELYHALGQYLIYQTAIDLAAIPFILYLVVPLTVYQKYFQARDVIRESINRARIRLIVIDLEFEEVVSWVD